MTSRGWGRRSRRASWQPFIIGFLVLFVCAGTVLWSLPTGTGEYQNAPDKKYTAHLSHLSRGTWRGSRTDYAEATLVDAQTGGVLWHMEYTPAQPLPDYGDRDKHFIKWAADSNSVTFFFGGSNSSDKTAQKITVPVP